MNELPLLEHIKALEKKDRFGRGREVLSRLQAFGITPEIQKSRVLKITNYIVDFSRELNSQKHLVFCGHYDAVKGSPGANDNASSVAVLLGLCCELKDQQVPVKVIFFDREEAFFKTPLIRFGLLGSLYHITRNKLSNIEAVYNLEFCGMGDSLAVWPVKGEKKNLPAVKVVRKAAIGLGVIVYEVHVPGLLLSSDHESFRLKGVSNSITLTLLPKEQIPILKDFIKGLSSFCLISGQRPIMPGVLDTIHKSYDDSSRLSEGSLRLMLSLIRKIIDDYRFEKFS